MDSRHSRTPSLRKAAVTGLAVAGLLAAAVTGGRTAAPADPAGLDEQRLRDALLDHMDFPAGWASDSARAAERRGIGVPRPEERACRELFDSEEETSARAGFARTETGPFVTTVAATHDSPEDARRAVAAFRGTALEDCGSFETREGPDGSAVTVTYEVRERRELEPELDRLGGGAEDSAALRFHRRPPGETAGVSSAPVIADVVIAQVGAHTVRVAQAGRDDAGTGSVADIAARAVRKLQQVHDGRTPVPEPHQPGTTEL